MTDADLVAAIENRVARVTVGALTVRSRGNAGVVGASRSFLRALDLGVFGPSGKGRFIASLDKTTLSLRRSVGPHSARTARSQNDITIWRSN
jgi:hypothetical protein